MYFTLAQTQKVWFKLNTPDQTGNGSSYTLILAHMSAFLETLPQYISYDFAEGDRRESTYEVNFA